MRRKEVPAKLTVFLASFVLAALAAALVQAEARERGARHGAHPPRSVGQPHPAAARGANARPGSSSAAAHAVNPPSFSVPGPPGNPAKHLTHRPGTLEALKKSAARPASSPRFHYRASEPAPPFAVRNAIGLTTRPAGTNATAVGRATSPGAFSSGVKTNAIGAHPGVTASSPPAPAGLAKVGPAVSRANAVRPALPATSASVGTINGTGMTRPGFTPATLGGPAKMAAGISGTGLKSRAH